MISTTFALFLIWTLFPNSWESCCLSYSVSPILSNSYLLHSNLPIACSIPLKPHFSVFTMTSSAMDRGEVTSLILFDLSAAFDTVDHSILLHRLQHWFGLHGILLLSGFHRISPQVLRQSPSKIPSLAHLFSLFIQLLLALSSQRTESNTTSMLMICTFLSLLQIQLHHLKYSPILSLTYSPGWTLTNCSSIHPKPNSYSIYTHWYKTTTA